MIYDNEKTLYELEQRFLYDIPEISTDEELEKEHRCEYCNALLIEEDIFRLDGKEYCADCHDFIIDNSIICQKCGKRELIDETDYTDGAYTCVQCRSSVH